MKLAVCAILLVGLFGSGNLVTSSKLPKPIVPNTLKSESQKIIGKTDDLPQEQTTNRLRLASTAINRLGEKMLQKVIANAIPVTASWRCIQRYLRTDSSGTNHLDFNRKETSSDVTTGDQNLQGGLIEITEKIKENRGKMFRSTQFCDSLGLFLKSQVHYFFVEKSLHPRTFQIFLY